MKSFAVALILLLLTLGGIVWNTIYIDNVASALQEELDALPPMQDASCATAVQALRQGWEREQPYVLLSQRYSAADRITEQIAVLAACVDCGDIHGYFSALALLRDAAEDITRH